MGAIEQKDIIIGALILILVVCLYFWNKAVTTLQRREDTVKTLDFMMRNMIGGLEEGIGGYIVFTSGLERDSEIRLIKGIMHRCKDEPASYMPPRNLRQIREMVDRWSNEIISREDDVEMTGD